MENPLQVSLQATGAQATFAAYTAAVCASALRAEGKINESAWQGILAVLENTTWSGELAEEWRKHTRAMLEANPIPGK